MRQVISGEEAFGGPFTFIVGTVREQMAEDTESVLAIKKCPRKIHRFYARKSRGNIRYIV